MDNAASGPRLGTHVSTSGGLARAVERAVSVGAESMQIFTRSPLQWQGRALTEAEAEGFRRALLDSGIGRAVAHASYLINLAGDDWTRSRSMDALAAEIDRCDRLGIDAVVVHPGSGRGLPREAAVERAADAVREVLRRTERCGGRLLLETMAGQGETLGTSIRELADMIEMNAWDDRLGICVDLCHIYGAGMDVRSASGYDALVRTIEQQVGTSRVGCWHMSDNKGELGSKVDRHEHIGEGSIGTVPFGLLAADERFDGTPAILETPKDGPGDEVNLALLKKMRGR